MLGNTYHAQASSKPDDKTTDGSSESPPATPKKDAAAPSPTAEGKGQAKAKAKGKAKKAKTEQSSESSDPNTPLSAEKKVEPKKSRKQKLTELATLSDDKEEEVEEMSTGLMFSFKFM